jgi:hypothetical protein
MKLANAGNPGDRVAHISAARSYPLRPYPQFSKSACILRNAMTSCITNG